VQVIAGSHVADAQRFQAPSLDRPKLIGKCLGTPLHARIVAVFELDAVSQPEAMSA
jgi:hypothetical protein